MNRGTKKKLVVKKNTGSSSQLSGMSSNSDNIRRSIMHDSIIYKGYGDDSSQMNSSKISGTNSLYTDGASSPTFTIHRKHVKTLLEKIKTKAKSKISELDEEYRPIYNRLSEIVSLTHNTGIYTQLIKDISEFFPSTEKVIPLTVGAYFSGCFSSDSNFVGELQCNPKCAGNVMPNNMTSCEDSVLHFNGNNFEYQNQKKTNHAYIYVDSPKFTGFTMQHLNALKADHIFKVSLVYCKTSDIPKSDEVSGPIAVDKLPIKNNSSNSTTETITAEEVSWVWLICLIVLIVLILLALGYIFFYNK